MSACLAACGHRVVRWLLVFLGGICAMSAALAQAAKSCPPPAEMPDRQLLTRAQQQAADRGFLWRISRGGRDSFLYGTIHAGRAEWFALGPRVEAALFRTGLLALEVNLTDPRVLQSLQQVMKQPSRPMAADVTRSLRDAWAGECLTVADLETGPAELHVTQLAVARAQREGLFPLYGAESVLLMRSLAAQRPVAGLERIEAQLEALLARDTAEAEAMVRASLNELDDPKAQQVLRRLVGAWNSSDLDDLERYGDWCGCLETESQREQHARLIDARNPGMAAEIDRLHQEVSVFAAVGALHMTGPAGLPALLEARGFKVSRVF
jgi:uncharacterized protein